MNLASRLDGLTRELNTDILVSATVANHVSDRFVVPLVGQTRIKGHADPVPVHELRYHCLNRVISLPAILTMR